MGYQPGPPPPRIVIGDSSQADGLSRNVSSVKLLSDRSVHRAGRRTTPCWHHARSRPCRHERDREACALSATIILVLRAAAGVLGSGCGTTCAKALSFWNRRNRQASWIRPRRTLSVARIRASPFSRRLGAALVRRAREPGVASDGPPVAHDCATALPAPACPPFRYRSPIDARQQLHHRMWSDHSASCFDTLQASLLDLPRSDH